MSNSDAFPLPVTRREAIKKTLLFSSSLLAASFLPRAWAQDAPTAGEAESGIHLFAFGDFGTRGDNAQRAVAKQMRLTAQALGQPLAAVLALGDNFYGQLTQDRFENHFEQIYKKDALDCPFYAVLGNHDYGPKYDPNDAGPKFQMELDYSRDHPDSRFKMPAKWYVQEIADTRGEPLIRLICLDGNYWEGALTAMEKLEQRRFLESELAKPTKAPWTWMMSHYPLYADIPKKSGDNKRLIKEWGGLLKEHRVALYLSGHVHNQQHIKVEGYDTDFVISGGGGARLDEIPPSQRGYAERALGFTHLHVTREFFEVRVIHYKGDELYRFRQPLAAPAAVA